MHLIEFNYHLVILTNGYRLIIKKNKRLKGFRLVQRDTSPYELQLICGGTKAEGTLNLPD